MSQSPWVDDEATALQIVREGLSALDGASCVSASFGQLHVFSESEASEAEKLKESVRDYLGRNSPPRPLSFAVFGPPGSGKSFLVREVLSQLGDDSGLGPVRELNLSQLPTADALLTEFARITEFDKQHVPVVFFDEFDSSLQGTPLGWLQWLLAPMQDGIFRSRGTNCSLKRAVFVFAGGTADKLNEFSQIHEPYFHNSKGPDFLSRLRGHVDVRGPNAWPYRSVRRAVLVRMSLQATAPKLLPKKNSELPEKDGSIGVSDPFLKSLLSVGRYRHGARSVSAVLEMCHLTEKESFDYEDLPPLWTRAAHLDDGPLHGVVAALSAGGDNRGDIDNAFAQTSVGLLQLGASLAYGGTVLPGGFTALLAEAQNGLPRPLVRSTETTTAPAGPLAPPLALSVANYLAASHVDLDNDTALPSPVTFDVRKVPGPTAAELSKMGIADNTSAEQLRSARSDATSRLAVALALFRMRATVTSVSSARIVMGGRESGFSGRFPGIAEEVMLALALSQPVFVCGGFGGAANAVGQLLGLGSPWATIPDMFDVDKVSKSDPALAGVERKVKDWSTSFQTPGLTALPCDYVSLVSFLRKHALGNSGWPDNGLTVRQNQQLFGSSDPTCIAELVILGLTRLHDDRP